MPMLRKVLVANRGEIAVRIIATLRRLGIASVVVHHAVDRTSLAVRSADESVELVGDSPVASYLDVAEVVEACRATGSDGLHPGYGFLSENPALPQALQAAGIAFVGPPVDAMRALGDKVSARRLAIDAGVSVLPGTPDALPDAETAVATADEIGYPVMIKASAGGGGKGMRVARDPAELGEAFTQATAEARASFGDGRLFMEKFLARPRHVEVQVLGDRHGNVVHLGERECSVQRRHQKLIEEAPCAALDADTRDAMTSQAVALARRVGYESAGTVEFLLDEDGSFYFLEMNTRLQVEHGVTELITSTDIVAEQLRIAAGEELGFEQSDVTFRGHAIECRVCAEDPEAGFAPAGGRLDVLRLPQGDHVRIDHGLVEGEPVSSAFDPLLAKLLVYARDRPEAAAQAAATLDELVVLGTVTNTSYLARVLRHPAFVDGAVTTRFLEDHADELVAPPPTPEEIVAILTAAVLAGPASSDRFDAREPIASIGSWTNG